MLRETQRVAHGACTQTCSHRPPASCLPGRLSRGLQGKWHWLSSAGLWSLARPRCFRHDLMSVL